MKSINQWYNRERARIQAVLDKQGKKKTSKQLQQITHKRNRRLHEFLNQYANLVAQVCVVHKIGKVVMGEGWHAQEGSHIGDANNQNFVMLPFGKFAWKLRSKCELFGIEFKTINEAYTSKCDHLANEPMCHHDEYLGHRMKRGLFKSSTGVTLNADMHGALGIMLKAGSGKGLRTRLGRGVVNTPSRIRLAEIRQTSCVRLAESILLAATQAPTFGRKGLSSETCERSVQGKTTEPFQGRGN